MLLFKKAQHLWQHLTDARKTEKTVGFVPTMGALHDGHLSLVRQALSETDLTVCSIFVNPAQFNEPADLEKYPRTPASDIGLLAPSGCQVLFMPPVTEIYSPQKNLPPPVDFGYLDRPMEGAHRPGHFAGVAQVVRLLLDLVAPDKLYMGQKDFQQTAIVKNLLHHLQSPVHLVVCPIVREADGLAMSSRNVRLTPEQRALAPLIYRTLTEAKEKIHSLPPRRIEEEALASLDTDGMTPEYFDIVDGKTLEKIDDFGETDFAVACTAVKLGQVRLIDNEVLIGSV